MDRWLLLDYGQVLCTAPPADEWAALHRAARPDLTGDAFYELYWSHRAAYDRGDLTAAGYWAEVAPEADPASVAAGGAVRALDVDIWMHPHQPSVDALAGRAAEGWRLALFSNAPVEVAAAIDGLGWLKPVERRFYSCHLGRVKPEPEAYLAVLDGLGVEAGRVVFFDDREANVQAARKLGIRAHVFTDAAQLRHL
jgi:putative hydrolase of the HAD superfamily